MKLGTVRGKNRELLGGRNVLFAIIVLASSLSFTLGYFVGKAVMKGDTPQAQITQELTEEETASGISEETISSGEKTDDSELQPQTQEDALPGLKEKAFSPAQSPGIKVERAPAKSALKENKPAQDEVIYTIQAGAFKSHSNAFALRRQLESKGYKVYIKKIMEAKSTRPFKVRIGEFKDRGKAEAVALKLKREGSDAFVVTSKTETAHETEKTPRPVKQEKLR